MRAFKFVIAVALFTTSVSFSDQVVVTKNGLVSNWQLQIGATSSYALEQVEFE